MSGCSGPSAFSRIASARSMERPRGGEIALGLQQDCEVVEAGRGVGMLGAERLLADRQRALEERPGARIGPDAMKILRGPVQKLGLVRGAGTVGRIGLAAGEEMRRQLRAEWP